MIMIIMTIIMNTLAVHEGAEISYKKPWSGFSHKYQHYINTGISVLDCSNIQTADLNTTLKVNEHDSLDQVQQ